jgi:hypothetical protein
MFTFADCDNITIMLNENVKYTRVRSPHKSQASTIINVDWRGPDFGAGIKFQNGKESRKDDLYVGRVHCMIHTRNGENQRDYY